MTTPELIAYIKQQLQLEKSRDVIMEELLANGGWKKKDIQEAFASVVESANPIAIESNKVRKIFKQEIKLICIAILVGLIVYGAAIGAIAAFGLLGLIFVLILAAAYAGIGIAVIVAFAAVCIVTIFRVQKIQHTVSIRAAEIDSDIYKKFKSLCLKIYVINVIFLLLVAAVITGMLHKDHMRMAQKETQKIEDKRTAIQSESERIKSILGDFKQSLDSTQSAFTGFGMTPNAGSCINPTLGSIYNPGDVFQPKLLIDPDWKNHSVVNTVKETAYGVITIKMGNGDPILNNLNDARCYSDEDHYALQTPNYLEDPYPTFYCVDDIHPGVQKGSKQIKGPNCDDIDPAYQAPAIRPGPDIKSFQ